MADNFLSKFLQSLAPDTSRYPEDLDKDAFELARASGIDLEAARNTLINDREQKLNKPAPSDGDMVRNILMQGVLPETTTPNFTGKDQAWWTQQGPIKQDQMPPSPLKPEIQDQMIQDTARANLTGQPIRMPAAISEPIEEEIKPKSSKAKPKIESEEEEVSKTIIPQIPEGPKEPSMLEKLLADVNAPAEEDQELKDALEHQQETMRHVGVLRGAQKIGAALGGLKGDDRYLESLNEQAKAKVSGVKELRESQAQKQKVKQEKVKFAMDTEKGMLDLDKARSQSEDMKAMQDPNSELSKAWREAARTRFKLAGVNIPKNLISNNLPASKVKELFPSGDIVDDLIRLKGMEESAAARKEAKSERNQQIANQQVDRYIQGTQRNVAKNVEKVQEGRTALAALESAIRSPSSVKDTQALYNMIKSFDPDSAVREGEIALAEKGQSYIDNMKNIFSKVGNNPRLLTTRYLKDIYEYAKAAQKGREKNYRQTMDVRINYAKERLGLPEGQEIFLDPLYEEKKKSTSDQQAPSPFNVDAAKAELERRKKGQ